MPSLDKSYHIDTVSQLKPRLSGDRILLYRPHIGRTAVLAVVPVIPEHKILFFPQLDAFFRNASIFDRVVAVALFIKISVPIYPAEIGRAHV